MELSQVRCSRYLCIDKQLMSSNVGRLSWIISSEHFEVRRINNTLRKIIFLNFLFQTKGFYWSKNEWREPCKGKKTLRRVFNWKNFYLDGKSKNSFWRNLKRQRHKKTIFERRTHCKVTASGCEYLKTFCLLQSKLDRLFKHS